VLSRRLRDLLWVALAAAGVGLLGLADGGAAGWNWVGVGFALVAGAFWALYILTSARVGAAVPGQSGLAVAVAVAALVLLPGAGGAGHAFTDLRLLVLAAATGLLASVVPYSLELTALRLLPPRVFGVLLSLEPAVATLAGWLLLHQGLGLLGAVAVGVVILASAGSTLSARRPDDAPSPEPADPPDRARTDQHGAEESSVRPH